ncbi:unnamed protein product [Notodromas monacha]|uniref:Bcl-2 Bcl-2 homology region 1-3 domain-containing protein n=1 Tax=Notodromas monacha TaxID=399045 RepID=A0A7R9BWR7_9CRUS|nr:unnamed protein product [Notodromas monacha]CAG0923144.1 unnamed protein product [Notodromas monacha]
MPGRREPPLWDTQHLFDRGGGGGGGNNNNNNNNNAAAGPKVPALLGKYRRVSVPALMVGANGPEHHHRNHNHHLSSSGQQQQQQQHVLGNTVASISESRAFPTGMLSHAWQRPLPPLSPIAAGLASSSSSAVGAAGCGGDPGSSATNKSSTASSALRKISATTQRKFSTVTDAVSRKVSTTIWGLAGGSGIVGTGYYGGGTPNLKHMEIASQSKTLASQYIRARLKRSGFFHLRKLVGLQRLRSLANIPGGIVSTTIWGLAGGSGIVGTGYYGGGTPNLKHMEIASQSKTLASQYIRARLKRSGFFHLRKLVGLQRLRSLANIPGGIVFHELLALGQELERMHPKLYSSVCRQLSITVTSDKVLRSVLIAIAAELFKADITWSRIVSLYAVTGGLAVDCVKQGHPEFLPALVEAVGDIMEQDLAAWIVSQGGWAGLLILYKDPENEPSMVHSLVVLIMIISREHAYMPSHWASSDLDPNEVITRHINHAVKYSEEARKSVPCRLDLSYGSEPRQKIDIYGEDGLASDAPVVLFIHGGYWQELNKELSAYFAKSFFEGGIITIVADYTLAPEGKFNFELLWPFFYFFSFIFFFFPADMDQIVGEMTKLEKFVDEWARKRESRSLTIVGHSAGAHLAAMMIANSEHLHSLGILKGAFLISGLFDLLPVLETSANEPLQMDKEKAKKNSPINRLDQLEKWTDIDFRIVLAERDPPAFSAEQSLPFHEGLRNLGLKADFQIIPETNHFTIVENLSSLDDVLTREIIAVAFGN